MDKKEYADYEAAVAHFFESEGINCLTLSFNDDEPCEPYFSWQSCDCCGTTLGGDRYEASAYHTATKQILEYEICPDCLYYAEYGQLDDQTMLDMEES